MWNFALTTLNVDVTQYEVILTESELNVGKDRATMAQIIFEEYGAPGLYIGNESALSLYAYLHKTGVVVNCGHLVTTIAMFYRDQLITNKILNYGGRDVTIRLLSDLVKSGYDKLNPQNPAHVTEVQKIKEKVTCVSCKYDEDVRFPDRMDSIPVPCEVVKDNVRNDIF